MTLSRNEPEPPLDDCVGLLWAFQRGPRSPAPVRLLPTGTFELVIELGASLPRAVVYGAHSKPFEILAAGPATVLGVHFKPGGAFPFFGVPAGDLHNSCVPLEQLWGSRTNDLLEQVAQARTVSRKLRVLQESLLADAGPPPAPHPAVTYALQAFQAAPPSPTITPVIRHVGLSSRRFIEVFTSQVGLTPKLYSRVLRFQIALHRIHDLDQVRWTDIALECGYYDQAHFISDFQEFSGLTPAAFGQQSSNGLNHVPLTTFPLTL